MDPRRRLTSSSPSYTTTNLDFNKQKVLGKEGTKKAADEGKRERTPSPPPINDPKNYLENLATKAFEVYPVKIESLLALKDSMSAERATNCFDSEDFELIECQLQKLTEERDLMVKEYEYKSKLFFETLATMENTVRVREEVLNGVHLQTNLFRAQPEITSAFVTKQVDLIQKVEELRQKIQESWYDEEPNADRDGKGKS